jgi:glycosyltransferase involved in cell wall biosynthesis
MIRLRETPIMKVLAVLCIRNEAVHLRRCLGDLIASGVDVFLIDNGSTDASRRIASEFLGRGLVGIEDLAWTGEYSLPAILRAKQRVIAACDYDWIIHTDADEWLCSPVDGQPLFEGIAEADSAGYNCINFHEIVFVPLPGENFVGEDYAARMSTYYFFQPRYPRLQRAWARRADAYYGDSGGHRLRGAGVKQYPKDFFLRHYIILSEPHARAKYLGRPYSSEGLSRGWHKNKLTITADNLRVKQVPGLWRMDDPGKQHFNLSVPLRHHFWEW